MKSANQNPIWSLFFISVLVLAALTTGCAHTYTLTPDSPSESFDRLNGAMEGKTVDIKLIDNTIRQGSNVHVSKDSVSWSEPDELVGEFLPRQSVAVADITQIVLTNRTKSTIIGAGIGFLAGATFAVVPALLRGESSTGGTKRGDVIIKLLPFFGTAGGIAGGVFGARKGVIDTYMFSEFGESEQDMLARRFAGRSEAIIRVFDEIREAILSFGPRPVSERITPSNVLYLTRRSPFCYIVVQANVIQIYLSVSPSSIKDPQGMLRSWASGDSTFRVAPGDDIKYAISLIEQAYDRSL